MLSKLVGIAPDSYTGLTTKKVYVSFAYEMTLVLSLPVRCREHTEWITMSQHHYAVSILNGMYYLRVCAGFVNMQATILSLLIKKRKNFCCRVICMDNYHTHLDSSSTWRKWFDNL